MPCKMTKQWLKNNGVDFKEVNVEEDLEAFNELVEMNLRTLPVVFKEYELIAMGFQPQNLKGLIQMEDLFLSMFIAFIIMGVLGLIVCGIVLLFKSLGWIGLVLLLFILITSVVFSSLSSQQEGIKLVKLNKTLQHTILDIHVKPVEKFQKVDPLKRTNQIMTYYKCEVDTPRNHYEDIFEKRYLEGQFEEVKCKQEHSKHVSYNKLGDYPFKNKERTLK